MVASYTEHERYIKTYLFNLFNTFIREYLLRSMNKYPFAFGYES